MRLLKQLADYLQDKPVERPLLGQHPSHDIDLASPNVTVEASHVKWTRVSAVFKPVFRPKGESAVA